MAKQAGNAADAHLDDLVDAAEQAALKVLERQFGSLQGKLPIQSKQRTDLRNALHECAMYLYADSGKRSASAKAGKLKQAKNLLMLGAQLTKAGEGAGDKELVTNRESVYFHVRLTDNAQVQIAREWMAQREQWGLKLWVCPAPGAYRTITIVAATDKAGVDDVLRNATDLQELLLPKPMTAAAIEARWFKM